jgi:S1-C subfamily serine protease
MKTILRVAAVIVFCLWAAIFLGRSPEAAVYKYQDQNGIWHFSDTPPDVAEDAVEQMVKDKKVKITTGTDLQKQLSKKLPAQNKIEQARNATVSIKTALRYGSGFFISENGYIVTNKHVVHGGAQELAQDQIELEKEEEKLGRIANLLSDENYWLEEENAWLMEAKAELENVKRRIEKRELTLSSAQISSYNAYTSEYNVRLGVYMRRKSEYDRLEQQYNNKEASFQKRKYEYDEMDIKLHSQRGCTVILADETELIAKEVAVSDKHDLLLLKIDGYVTPFISPGNVNQLAHGEPLYAIGNPINFAHSVTSGVFSGFREDLIQSSAQVNPGNSGGPLITKEGDVIGVNTKKIVHQEVEGISFAIPIHIVLNEFNNYLGQHTNPVQQN